MMCQEYITVIDKYWEPGIKAMVKNIFGNKAITYVCSLQMGHGEYLHKSESGFHWGRAVR